MSGSRSPALVTRLLIGVVEEQSRDEPIVPAATVRWRFQVEDHAEMLQERARTPGATYNGPGFQYADNEATRLGLLVKWKRSAEKQREVGWSLPSPEGSDDRARIEAWARRKGWRRV
jgi:hypothetical protein